MNQPDFPFPTPNDRIRVDVVPPNVTVRIAAETATLSSDEALGLSSAMAEAATRATQGNEETDDMDVRLIPMQYLKIESEQIGEDTPIEDGDDVVGPTATVHVWIRGQTFKNGQFIATGLIEEDDLWVPVELLEQREVQRAEFLESDFLPYFDQALTDGEVIVIETPEEE
jgi:hypothetical protein